MNAIPARAAGVAAHRHVRPHPRRRAQPAGARRRPPRRCVGNLPRRGRAGRRRHGLRHRHHRAGRPYRRPRQCLCRRGQAPGLRPRRNRQSIAGPSEVVVLADAAQNPRHVAVDLLAQAEPARIRSPSSSPTTRPSPTRWPRPWPTKSPPCPAPPSPKPPGATTAQSSWCATGPKPSPWSTNSPGTPPTHDRGPRGPARPHPSRRRGFPRPELRPEALGDSIAGPTHVLPTGRTARFASGLSVFDFLKRTT